MLNFQQKRHLKQKAHKLRPVIIIGNHGLTDAVQLEIDRALEAHELIKVRINAIDSEERKTMIQAICEYQKSEFVQLIGHVATFYRKRIET